MTTKAIIEYLKCFKEDGFSLVNRNDDNYIVLARADKETNQIDVVEIDRNEEKPNGFVLEKKDLEKMLSLFK
jgi:protease II